MATCPYCDKQFNNKTQEGIHRSKTHIKQKPIPKTGQTRNKKENILNKWQKQ